MTSIPALPLWISLLLTLLLPLPTQAMSLSLPLEIDGRVLGDIAVNLDGTVVDSVSYHSLKSLLGPKITDEVWQSILAASQDSNDMISLKALAQKGLDITFNPSTLSLDLSVKPEAFGLYDVDFSDPFSSFIPSKSGSFSWLNSINFNHSQNWEARDNSHFSSIDWLAQMNFGGATGVNLSLANHIEVTDETNNFLRGEWVAFYDKPNMPFRLSIGDVGSGTNVAGHLSGISMGGLSVSSNYAELQPDRVIGPNNNQELILKESAEVEITVNGQLIFSGRQEAGRFNLNNLPMTNGANDIIVDVTYLSGKSERFVFSQFYNSKLLNEDMLNFGLSAGAPSIYAENGVDYLDTWTVMGFAEYGVSSWLTLGVNGAIAQYGQILGATATLGTSWGNLSSRVSLSNLDDTGIGSVVSFTFESTVAGNSNNTPNLRVSADFADSFTSSPWDIEVLPTSYERYLANYVWVINNAWDTTISGSYYKDTHDTAQSNLSMTINWRSGDWTLGSGVTYNDAAAYNDDNDEVEYFFTIDWRRSNTQNRLNLAANYNSANQYARLEASKTNNDRVGSLGYRAQLEYEDGRDSQNAQFDYTANRLRVELEVERNNNSKTNNEASYTASIRGNTAIGIVDGHIGWGRSKEGPFVISKLHPSLSEQEILLGVDQNQQYEASGTSNIGALLPLDVAYITNTIDLNVPNAPIGYDWGESRLTISPGAATGHVFMIGSNRSYTAKGVLQTSNGEPISYLQGTITSKDFTLAFFTNKSGRFYIQGIEPGKYEIKISSQKYKSKTLTITQNNSHLIDLGTLYISCIKENCNENM
ncbi:fimbria/pilus outer membrane usher protein [Shewanella pneumatophori]|uniref:Fimbria/pilus outer membrane usher protein n=1 Tax=Shewanella pneumatophori TaxID=314092 RepID=A0A9X2CDD3_9GAMM|nr:fimbria/pilus outer membrane usher protein [Shewanella pneumatophori]